VSIVRAHLAPGTILPNVNLPATDGSKVCPATLPYEVSLPSILGQGALVTPTRELRHHPPEPTARRRSFKAFAISSMSSQSAVIAIYGPSNQTTEYQREMVERRGLPFPMLSDTEGRFAAALALPFATGGETYLRRLTLIVVNGRIERVFYTVPEPALHAGEVVAWLAHSPSASSSASSTE
jgi:peroxiredoxin